MNDIVFELLAWIVIMAISIMVTIGLVKYVKTEDKKQAQRQVETIHKFRDEGIITKGKADSIFKIMEVMPLSPRQFHKLKSELVNEYIN